MGLGDEFGFFAYQSDDGTDYAVKLSFNVASAGGFNSSADPATQPVWPYHSRNMRHVYGITVDGKRTKLPIGTNGNDLYATGGTFGLNGRTYNVEGQIGEKRKKNSIA